MKYKILGHRADWMPIKSNLVYWIKSRWFIVQQRSKFYSILSDGPQGPFGKNYEDISNGQMTSVALLQ